ncbi:hypothetical protein [Pareuzebyella sediminis]|uniref:hypothetical protein n=1 Tax=Pareuzebyella sediminis TaxID=2607998 RepID=UPI0011EC9830|nr:hypothetical protein [Pareuzebyella sediminis]
METTGTVITAIILFAVMTFIVWRLSKGRFKKEFGTSKGKLWGQRTFFWEGVIGISTGITFLLLLLLRWGHVLTF